VVAVVAVELVGAARRMGELDELPLTLELRPRCILGDFLMAATVGIADDEW
jgi:hypothetical protein